MANTKYTNLSGVKAKLMKDKVNNKVVDPVKRLLHSGMPHVGIFYIIGEESIRTSSIPWILGEDHDGVFHSLRNHKHYWENIKSQIFMPFADFEYLPRGCVLYDKLQDVSVIHIDACSGSQTIIDLVCEQFKLLSQKTIVVKDDPLYTCYKCNIESIDPGGEVADLDDSRDTVVNEFPETDI